MKPRSTPALWLRRLDFLPPWVAWVLGLGGGALAGAALAGAAPGTVGVFGFLGLLGAAAGLAASGEPIAVVERVVPEAKPPLVDLVEIPGGSFLMGSPEDEEGRYDDEGPVHSVRISPFACMRFPVTRRLYTEILGQNPGLPKGNADAQPVNNVSWFDAVEFCNHLSEWEGLEPCYRIEGENVEWNRAASGYRLLTEAEWEYACRAGTTTRWSFGDSEMRFSELPNAWALYYMHGNVWEWCWDWFGPYTAEPQTDPKGPDVGEVRSLRGGSVVDWPEDQRSANREGSPPTISGRYIGFRCARSLHRQR